MNDRPTSPRPVLLTVSGRIPDDLGEHVAAKRRPRADYVTMQADFDADLVDVDTALAATGRVGMALHRSAGAGALLAWYCFRRRTLYDVVVTDGEQVGIPLAILCRIFGRRRARHLMIVHILSVPKKARLIRLTRIARLIDRYVVYCSWQQNFIHEHFGVPKSDIVLSTFMVDSQFFDPNEVDVTPRRMICSAGLERRDYPTLMRAVDGLDVDVVIAAASPWSKRDDSTTGYDIPSNVEIRRLSLFELRALYAASAAVVMPLEEVDFQAGITTILEAMSMGRPIICTTTPGQTDTIVDDVTGRYVRGDDAAALRSAIVELLDDESLRTRLGAAAREWIIEHADIDRYSQRLAVEVQILRDEPPRQRVTKRRVTKRRN